MKQVSFIRRHGESTKLIIAEDGRKLGCPYSNGERECGTWCALFDVVVRATPSNDPQKTRSWVTCRENFIAELVEDFSEGVTTNSAETRC